MVRWEWSEVRPRRESPGDQWRGRNRFRVKGGFFPDRYRCRDTLCRGLVYRCGRSTGHRRVGPVRRPDRRAGDAAELRRETRGRDHLWVSSAAGRCRHPRPAWARGTGRSRRDRVLSPAFRRVVRRVVTVSPLWLRAIGRVGLRRGTLPTPTGPSTPDRVEEPVAGAGGAGCRAPSPRTGGTTPRAGWFRWWTQCWEAGTEVGGHDRVELRVQPGWIGIDQFGEPAFHRVVTGIVKGRVVWGVRPYVQLWGVQHCRSLPGNVVSCSIPGHVPRLSIFVARTGDCVKHQL